MKKLTSENNKIGNISKKCHANQSNFLLHILLNFN